METYFPILKLKPRREVRIKAKTEEKFQGRNFKIYVRLGLKLRQDKAFYRNLTLLGDKGG